MAPKIRDSLKCPPPPPYASPAQLQLSLGYKTANSYSASASPWKLLQAPERSSPPQPAPCMVLGQRLSEGESILPYNSVQECPTQEINSIHVDMAWGVGGRGRIALFFVCNPYVYGRPPFLKFTISLILRNFKTK